jgi:methylmalonyl-CoA mutase
VSVADAKELAQLLAVVCEHKMSSVIECGSSGASVAAMLASVPSHVSACVIGVRHDPWSEKLRGKQPACSLQNLLDQALLAIEIAEQLPALKTACAVDARLVAESGGTSVQELSFALSAVAELLRAAEIRGVAPHRILNTVEVLFSQGSDVFLEIAKLRAFRVLWSNLRESFEAASLPRVTAVGSLWNITTDETHTNLLRLTASVLSAVSGGATRVELPPFTGEVIQQDSFASDLSIGLQHVVAHESRLFDVIDPAGGSFYVEDLTRSLAEAAWEQFRAHERLGGLVSVLEKGQFQQEISREAALRAEAVHSGRAIFVGLNKFRSEPVSPTNEDENMRARRESRQQELVNREAKSPRVANLTSAKELLEGAEKGATLQALSNGLRARDAKFVGKTVLVSIPVFRVQRVYDESLPAL